jgi:predicted metal-dependent hydrolase
VLAYFVFRFFVKKTKKQFKKLPRVSRHYRQNKEEARQLILADVHRLAPVCGVTLKRIAIRDQRRRWGSCSSLGNLNFNYRLAFIPVRLREYVVVHELCHLKELNHSEAFWAHVEAVLPDYKLRVAELRELEKTLFRTSLSDLELQKI